MTSDSNLLIALAGQPNCGKSTVFNMLTGAHQHVANYPGVTVEKKTGFFNLKERKAELVDLPGTYSLTSYSLEERVARDFLLYEKPEVCINVVDVSALKRSLFLTLQLMEMDCPVVLAMNMMDKAQKDGVEIDVDKLKQSLGVEVVPTSAKSGEGKKELAQAIDKLAKKPKRTPRQTDFGPLEDSLAILHEWLENEHVSLDVPARWLTIKVLEKDDSAVEYVQKSFEKDAEFLALADSLAKKFEEEHNVDISQYIATCRYKIADEIVRSCQKKSFSPRAITNAIDSVVCHKIMGPICMVLVVYLLYEFSIVQGYKLTNYFWPLLAKIKELTGLFTPAPGFIEDPILRALLLWLVDSVNALLNYIPIFLILFSLIAFLEDSGYMPRMAFILDRFLNRFGLHGQSTLPLVLGGVYVGGCAVPAIMSTKAIPDHRARIATILTIPMLNCLAKVPLYILLINAYFPEHKGLSMFFISTISLIMALPASKMLTLTVLKKEESAPFIMEMPDYNLPTVGGILRSALQKVWLFVKKIITIVAAVAVIVFVLLRFPGISNEKMQDFQVKANTAKDKFMVAVEQSSIKDKFTKEDITPLVIFADEYQTKRMTATSKEAAEGIAAKFQKKNPLYYAIVLGRGAEYKVLGRELKQLIRERKLIRMAMQKERIDKSFLGTIGKSLEPVTKWAGFNWRINVALLSALAAKENTVATLGALYQGAEGENIQRGDVGASMKETEKGFTSLHALSLMLFMIIYPPCLATLISIKLQTGSYKFLFLSLGYQVTLGTLVAILVFTVGSALHLTGVQAMIAFYAFALLVATAVGFIPNPPLDTKETQPLTS